MRKPLEFVSRYRERLMLKERSVAMASVFGEAA